MNRQPINEEDWERLKARIKGSKFRGRFKLREKEVRFIGRRGMDVVRSHADEFVRTRIAPATPPKEGKQTPMRTHPVFVAQHSTATCCRGCMAKWHGIDPGRPLDEGEIEYVVSVIMAWIEDQKARISAIANVGSYGNPNFVYTRPQKSGRYDRGGQRRSGGDSDRRHASSQSGAPQYHSRSSHDQLDEPAQSQSSPRPMQPTREPSVDSRPQHTPPQQNIRPPREQSSDTQPHSSAPQYNSRPPREQAGRPSQQNTAPKQNEGFQSRRPDNQNRKPYPSPAPEANGNVSPPPGAGSGHSRNYSAPSAGSHTGYTNSNAGYINPATGYTAGGSYGSNTGSTSGGGYSGGYAGNGGQRRPPPVGGGGFGQRRGGYARLRQNRLAAARKADPLNSKWDSIGNRKPITRQPLADDNAGNRLPPAGAQTRPDDFGFHRYQPPSKNGEIPDFDAEQ